MKGGSDLILHKEKKNALIPHRWASFCRGTRREEGRVEFRLHDRK